MKRFYVPFGGGRVGVPVRVRGEGRTADVIAEQIREGGICVHGESEVTNAGGLCFGK